MAQLYSQALGSLFIVVCDVTLVPWRYFIPPPYVGKDVLLLVVLHVATHGLQHWGNNRE
jgi:hypothetical protein